MSANDLDPECGHADWTCASLCRVAACRLTYLGHGVIGVGYGNRTRYRAFTELELYHSL